jgi:hypothetical protein
MGQTNQKTKMSLKLEAFLVELRPIRSQPCSQ